MSSVFFANLPYLLKGAFYTITLSVITIGCGLALGTVLGALAYYGTHSHESRCSYASIIGPLVPPS